MFRESYGIIIDFDVDVVFKVWIDSDCVIFSLDSLGESLYKCGYKEVIGKVLMCENMVVLFLWDCGYKVGMVLVDLMCGFGMFLIEVVEILLCLLFGCSCSFVFE